MTIAIITYQKNCSIQNTRRGTLYEKNTKEKFYNYPYMSLKHLQSDRQLSNHVVINQNRKYEISQKQTQLFLQVNKLFISKIVMSLHSLIKSMVGLNNYCKYCFFTNLPGILKIFCLQPEMKENKINVIIGHVCIQHTCMS